MVWLWEQMSLCKSYLLSQIQDENCIYSESLGISCKEQERMCLSQHWPLICNSMQIASCRVQVHSNMWHFSQLIVLYILYFWKSLEVCLHDNFPFLVIKKKRWFTVKSTFFTKVTREKLLAFSSILFPFCIVKEDDRESDCSRYCNPMNSNTAEI